MELLVPGYGLIAWTLLTIALIVAIWVTALSHLVKNDSADRSDKISWAVIICLLPILGGLLYFAFGRKGIIIQTNHK